MGCRFVGITRTRWSPIFFRCVANHSLQRFTSSLCVGSALMLGKRTKVCNSLLKRVWLFATNAVILVVATILATRLRVRGCSDRARVPVPDSGRSVGSDQAHGHGFAACGDTGELAYHPTLAGP